MTRGRGRGEEHGTSQRLHCGACRAAGGLAVVQSTSAGRCPTLQQHLIHAATWAPQHHTHAHRLPQPPTPNRTRQPATPPSHAHRCSTCRQSFAASRSRPRSRISAATRFSSSPVSSLCSSTPSSYVVSSSALQGSTRQEGMAGPRGEERVAYTDGSGAVPGCCIAAHAPAVNAPLPAVAHALPPGVPQQQVAFGAAPPPTTAHTTHTHPHSHALSAKHLHLHSPCSQSSIPPPRCAATAPT
jgi:hypothetical protein